METKANFSVLESLENIYNHSKDSQLREALFEKTSEDILKVSQYLNCNEKETVLFANAFVLWFENNNFSEVFTHFGLKEFHILKYRSEIENLYSKNLLVNIDKKKINKYEVPQFVILAVSQGKIMKQNTVISNSGITNLVDILEEFNDKSDEFDTNKISFYEFHQSIEDLVEEHLKYPLFAEIKKYRLSNFETFFLLDTIWDAVRKGDNDFNTSVQITVDDYFKRKSESIHYFNKIIKGETKLTKLNLIELSKEQYINRSEVKLSDKMLKFLHEKEELLIDNFSEGNKKLIQFNQIKNKELFYNAKEITQIKILENALHQTKFKELQENLSKRNLPKGIAILLHGAPGTGKTETVYQLAKLTKRNIYKVDISETKSMWFGESQKLIKKVFREYQEMQKTEKNCPILLFNEADGIISKRKEAGSSNVADTENAIQNIILEEMENFDGILFATTNLVKNMDTAFERRFLFKVLFENPDTEISAKIWKNKLAFLTKDEATRLAERFPFSGGEIENIARKSLMNELLNNTETTFYDVMQFCSQEKWGGNDGKRIGF